MRPVKDFDRHKGNAGAKNNSYPRFDWEAFFLGIGMGVVFIAIGLFLAWGIITAPGIVSNSSGFTLSQRLARVLPATIQQRLAFVLAGFFVFFGILCAGLGLGVVVKYLAAKNVRLLSKSTSPRH